MDIIEPLLRAFKEIATTGHLSSAATKGCQQVVLVLIALIALITCVQLFRLSGGSLLIAVICTVLAVHVTIYIESTR